MAASKKKPPSWPFLFLDHGAWSARDETPLVTYTVLFERPVPEGERSAVQEGRPRPLSIVQWMATGRCLSASNRGFFDVDLYEAYVGPLPTDPDGPAHERLDITAKEIGAFCDDVDAWLGRVHERSPVAAVLGSKGKRSDPWSKWSRARYPDVVYPILRDVAAGFRPVSDETTAAGTPERLMAWLVEQLVAGDPRDKLALPDAEKDVIEALLLGVMPYHPDAYAIEYHLYHLGRPVQKRQWLKMHQERTAKLTKNAP
jgi:hypothetical protein